MSQKTKLKIKRTLTDAVAYISVVVVYLIWQIMTKNVPQNEQYNYIT